MPLQRAGRTLFCKVETGPRGRHDRLGKRILVSIAGSGNGIADCGVTIDLDERWAHGRFKTRVVSETQAAGSCVIQMFVEQKLITQERETSDSDYRRRECMSRLHDEIL